MLTITNPKLAGLAPRWASYRGLTVLFDNPGLRRDGPWLRLDCALDAVGELGLYRALRAGLAELDPDALLRRHLLCALPPATYHVTLWDGPNDGSLGQAHPAARAGLADLLADVIGALGRGHPTTGLIGGSALLRRRGWRVELGVSRLVIAGDVALVALLEPTPAAAAALAELTGLRGELTASFRARYGVAPHDPYTPHVTLGYFADPALARAARADLPAWAATVLRHTAGQTVCFTSASLYGMLDMVTFFRTLR